MEFKINGDTWKIIKKDSKTLINHYNVRNQDKTNFTYGVTAYAEHEIWINENMCIEQQIKTLKHELTHCYIWNYGLYNAPNFNEEMVCDLVASINDFINEIVSKYKDNIFNEIQKEADKINEEVLIIQSDDKISD